MPDQGVGIPSDVVVMKHDGPSMKLFRYLVLCLLFTTLSDLDIPSCGVWKK